MLVDSKFSLNHIAARLQPIARPGHMLTEEIDNAQLVVRTDAYQMSVGEIVTMYDDGEIIIDPDFQRLFRWNIGQKSKLIESLLLGIPIPSIFVFEKEDGNWELIDGLQRISTILEFMGRLKDPDGGLKPPSILEETKYLPSLHNVAWEGSERVSDVPQNEQSPLARAHQIAIRRARLGVEILKRPSDDQTKYDLFQRLNAGGTQANAQELRNCIMIRVNRGYFGAVKDAAERKPFQDAIGVTDEQVEKQRHMELAVRFLVHAHIPYERTLDVEEYIDEGIVRLATEGKSDQAVDLINRTFDLLIRASGPDVLRRYENGRHTGKVGLVALEGIAVGVAKNIAAIERLHNPEEFVRQKTQEFWSQEEAERFTSLGLRGTTRIQRTIPFGEAWFRP